MAVAPSGDCLADTAVLRAGPEPFGPVASDPVVSRLVTAPGWDAPQALTLIRAASVAAQPAHPRLRSGYDKEPSQELITNTPAAMFR